MKYYIISGEASGDLHGSNLVKEIKKLDREASVRAWGGDMMKAAGAEVVKHYRELAFMGFAEVIANLPAILNNIRFCKKDITAFNPDVLVLIDYPGFNIRIAKWAKENGYKVIYYISPQVWAWKEGRVKVIRKVVDRMLVILPFEKEFYEKWSYKVSYVGHPLVQVISEFQEHHHEIKDEAHPVIALLPGSRKQEVSKKLPVMLEASKSFKEYRFAIAKAPSLDDDYYSAFTRDYPNVESVRNHTYHLLSRATAALVTSGTATLETALFGVPEVVCYKGSSISYQIAKRLIRIKYISLVNLIMDKQVVTELIQDEMNVENIVRELNILLYDTARKEQIQNDYRALKKLLQEEKNASARAAQEIIGFLTSEAK
ncbi:MAG: lipid-A-disaccharide synthase [Flavisolibacter sp.]